MTDVVDFTRLKALLVTAGSTTVADVAGELATAQLLIQQAIITAPKALEVEEQQTSTSVVSFATGDPEQLLTYEQAARFLSTSQSYIETMVRQRKLGAVTLPATAKGSREREGRARRIRLSVLKAFIGGEV